MKVGLIGDIHANLPALEAVLKHAREREVETIWNIGDFVGYSTFPDEVVKKLREEDVLSIVGNYDLKVLKYRKKKKQWRESKKRKKLIAIGWAFKNLSKKSRKYLDSLPQERRVKIKGRRILITHASPASNEESLRPDTPEKRFHKLAKLAKADVVIFGHSHRPFSREVDGVLFVNTGSVGRPNDGDPRASYAILRIGKNKLKVKHYRVEYDVERAVAAIKDEDLPKAYGKMLKKGRHLDAVT